MSIETILASIDSEIHRLQQVRALLADVKPLSSAVTVAPSGKRPVGRPKGSKNKPAVVPVTASAKKRSLSEEARASIAAAQKKRWAVAKKASK